MDTIKSYFSELSVRYEKETKNIEEKRNGMHRLKEQVHSKYTEHVKKNKLYVGTKNPSKVPEEYERLKDTVDNIYDTRYNTYDPEFENEVLELKVQIFKLEQEIMQREKLNVCTQSWIEHLEYVTNLSVANDRTQLYTILNKKIADKKATWVAVGTHYLVWFKAGVCALDWCVETLFN